jgi:hypothetical protein
LPLLISAEKAGDAIIVHITVKVAVMIDFLNIAISSQRFFKRFPTLAARPSS